MSVKELKSFSTTSDLSLNNVTIKNAEIETFDANNVTLNNTTIDTLDVNNNSNLSFVTASQISFNAFSPDIVEFKMNYEVTSLLSTLTMTQMKGGIVIGNGAAIFKSNIDTAANLFSSFNLLNGQCISVLCVNKSAFQWNFDLLDPTNVNFNNNGANPSIPANSQKLMIVQYTGNISTPSYTIYL